MKFTVIGLPVSQGSKRHVGRGIMVESSKNLRPWRDSVTAEARIARDGQMDGALLVACDFYLPRPKGHYGTGRNQGVLKPTAPRHPAKKPDIDKLARAILDALSAAGVYGDDAQVVRLEATKHYVTEHEADPLDVPGVIVTVSQTRSTR
ncbi:RusA family crossover junction endodeoxyribonuclease [Saxibacter everestensis]|uniref:RusA family crossover junction endodeoxyribonuclease n=1 Tax=Saxibacter everestensis TaxID=2909229 RepID=A0ABY8QV74_9MICO|nr:RusA family crossover junction endodeoxyribonuclease [Brevibacteriaceae bacterium ZFBP1038]